MKDRRWGLQELSDAEADGVIDASSAERLRGWLLGRGAPEEGVQTAEAASDDVETARGLNLVSVAYYLGTMLMISACAWFLGSKWDDLGSGGILLTVAIYVAIAAGTGAWLRSTGYRTAGGLLITVAVCLVPLATYCVEDLTGLWPTATSPGEYRDFYPWIRGGWVVMELTTMVVALLTLPFVRFGFLTAPLAFSGWFFSMDLAAWIGGDAWYAYDGRRAVSVVVGLGLLAIGGVLERLLGRQQARGEDFAFWSYLFGLMAFWGGLWLDFDAGEAYQAGVAVIAVALLGVGVALQRRTFLVFGGLGIYTYLGHLANHVFGDSALFPFVIAALGLSMILSAVGVQYVMGKQPATA